jgi:hypothetical protein
MNQSGQLLSVVAVHAGTDVVGHAALEAPIRSRTRRAARRWYCSNIGIITCSTE